MERPSCAFCDHVLPGGRDLLAERGLVVAFEDAFPSTPGHTLVIPKRHVGRVLELTAGEQAELWAEALAQLERLEAAGGADAYTIGINDGAAAGQTVPHVHLHVMPRSFGDTAEARGGVRWAVPETAPYWQCR